MYKELYTEEQLGTIQKKYRNEWVNKTCNKIVKEKNVVRNKWI